MEFDYTEHEKSSALIVDQLCPVIAEHISSHVSPELFNALTKRLAELTTEEKKPKEALGVPYNPDDNPDEDRYDNLPIDNR